MKIIALLLVIAASASVVELITVHVKANTLLLDIFRLNSFFEIPSTRDDAVSAGWVEVTDNNTTGMTTYCRANDPILCVKFDSCGNIAGVQVGIPVTAVTGIECNYNMSKFDTYQKKIIFGVELWTATLQFVDPAVIATGGCSDLDNSTETKRVWLKRKTGYGVIPGNVTELDSEWTKEACIPQMGTHYYYDMHNTTKCEDFQPWSLLYHNGRLVGALLQSFGRVTYGANACHWYETVLSMAIKSTIPTAPDCLSKWVANCTAISLHIYFTPEPWNISC